ncbi:MULTISPECIES: ZIP family metal transporter [Ramlibacter]|uniref:ZIP family metal transporter n=1 Tax=Ramlibacter aquaticus TaxID=2780094 RepID=A0ABR9SJV6_9BURK|nr:MULTISPECIES: ZIP family metal transporter [Ramlibacter]MBE7942651.1 ZIP family metal transporter [Ramlibacter aquaticus]
MSWLTILVATLGAGIGSVWIADGLMRIGLRGAVGAAGASHLLSLAAGALLATAMMQLLPEAFEGQGPDGVRALFAVLLGGLVFFFLLDKAELWHHGHEHHHAEGHGPHDHSRAHPHLHAQPEPHPHGDGPRLRSGGWSVLAGDSLHCFGDGLLIASAFAASPRLGWAAAFAVLAHEVPHHIGDLAVLRLTSASRRAALVKVSLAGALTALGGVAGGWLVQRLHPQLPYFLAVAASSFLYVALADLIPQLQARLSARQTVAQVLWLSAGIAVVTLVSRLSHG